MLVVIALAAGLIAGISPCILPVLPVVFMAGVASPTVADPSVRSWQRPMAIVSGLVVSFSFLVLAGSEIISQLHLPQSFLRDVGIGLLGIVGLGFLVPWLGHVLERPFARIVGFQPNGSRGGFIIGLALGLVFVPCAGPVFAAVTVLGATHHVNLYSVFITIAFAVGAVIPLLFVAVAGERLVSRVRALRERAPRLRQIGGVVLILMALGIFVNTFSFIQTSLPGYTSALQKSIEGSSTVRHQLNNLNGGKQGSLASCPSSTAGLVRCGVAPNFTNITAWLNTPGHRPLSMVQLRGKVVLIDFWTYSCINCLRTLPHVEAWNKRYSSSGLVIVGVHTPEFAFEHVVGNVISSATTLGVKYPIAIDNNYGTWNAYANQYWPAEYLVDASGVVRHVEFGEGNYARSEQLIRQLLLAAHPGITLPPPTSVPNLTPTGVINPETYVGYERLLYLDSPNRVAQNIAANYRFPSSLPFSSFGLSGVWTVHAQEATAGRGAALELSYAAQHIYLVMGGSGTVRVSAGAHSTSNSIEVKGVPRLYPLFHSSSSVTGVLTLHFSPGVQAFDFTFG